MVQLDARTGTMRAKARHEKNSTEGLARQNTSEWPDGICFLSIARKKISLAAEEGEDLWVRLGTNNISDEEGPELPGRLVEKELKT